MKWEYWYGPYIEWGFFVYLTALLFLLIVICCPEWAYQKNSSLYIFAEIGLFKQCYLSSIYKKTSPSGYCTLSKSSNNQGIFFYVLFVFRIFYLAWVNATQAFMLMAYIIGIIILIVIVIYRKEFRHNARGYHSQRVSQPTFTFIIAGLILFFCCKKKPFLFCEIVILFFHIFSYFHINWYIDFRRRSISTFINCQLGIYIGHICYGTFSDYGYSFHFGWSS